MHVHAMEMDIFTPLRRKEKGSAEKRETISLKACNVRKAQQLWK